MKNCCKLLSENKFTTLNYMKDSLPKLEKPETMRALLGTTQMEMALLLKVSMGQWSMFESGKRGLPVNALRLLTEMLTHMQKTEIKASQKVMTDTNQQFAIRQQLEGLLMENQLKLQGASKKAADAQRKYEGDLRAIQLVDFLTSEAKKQKAEKPHILTAIESRAVKRLEKNGQAQLTILQAKEQLLQLQQEWLEKKLRNY